MPPTKAAIVIKVITAPAALRHVENAPYRPIEAQRLQRAQKLDRQADWLLFVGRWSQAERLSIEAERLRHGEGNP